MSKKDVCTLPMVKYKTPSGETAEAMSSVFGKLRKDFPTRPDIAIKFYAITRTPSFIAKMQAKGYTTKRGEFDYDLILKELNIKKYIVDTSQTNIDELSLKFGIMNNQHQYKDFSQYDADTLAENINKTIGDNLVALVIQHGDKYNVTLVPKSPANTVLLAKQKQRQLLTQHLTEIYEKYLGLELSEVVKKTQSYDALGSVKIFKSIDKKLDDPELITNSEWKALIATQINKPNYKKFLEKIPEYYKTNEVTGVAIPEIDAVVNCMMDAIDGQDDLSELQDLAYDLSDDALYTFRNHADDILDPLNQIEDSLKESEEMQFLESIEELKKQNINVVEILQTNNALIYDKVTQLNYAALQLLKEKRDELNKHAVTEKEHELKKTLQKAYNELTKEAALADNYKSIVTSLLLYKELFQEEKNKLSEQLENIIKDDSLDFYTKAIEEGKIIRTLQKMVESYQTILKTAVNIESLQMVTDREKATEKFIKDEASKALADLELVKPLVAQAQRNMFKNLIITFRGDGEMTDDAIEALIDEASRDSSLVNKWFSGKCAQQNLYASIAGELVHRKQRERDKKVAEITNMIRQAEYKLRKAGFTSDFMYTKDGRIISPYDMTSWENDRKAFMDELKEKNLSKSEFSKAMANWHKTHSVTIINDYKGTTEYIPNDSYKDLTWFDNLAPAQREYYETMMGKIDAYSTESDSIDWTDPMQVGIKPALDNIAQDRGLHLFMPPQVKKDVLDELADRSNTKLQRAGLAAKKEWGRIVNMFNNSSEFLSDEERQEFLTKEEQIGDTIRPVIPMLYTERIDPKELRRDFGACLAKYANATYNYRNAADCLCCAEVIYDMATHRVKPLSMADRLKSMTNHTDVGTTQQVASNAIAVFENTNTAEAIKGIIERDIYNRRYSADTSLRAKKLTALGMKATHLMFLAFNGAGAIGNFASGLMQVLEHSAVGFTQDWGSFNTFNLIQALGVMSADLVRDAGGNITDPLTCTRSSFMHLLVDFFDPAQQKEQRNTDLHFDKQWLRLFQMDPLSALYAKPDKMLRVLMMYSTLMHKKLYYLDDQGKEQSVNLWQALTSTSKNGNATLCLNTKHNYYYKKTEEKKFYSEKYKRYMYKKTKSIVEVKNINSDFFDKTRDQIRSVTTEALGVISNDDKGTFTANCFGRLIMSLRNWMVTFIQRRYAKTHWDANKHKMVYSTWRGSAELLLWPALRSVQYGVSLLLQKVAHDKVHWISNLDVESMKQKGLPLHVIIDNLKHGEKGVSVFSDSQKEALLGMVGEIAVVGILKGLSAICLHWYDDDGQDIPKGWFARILAYALLRAKSEAETLNPAGWMAGAQSTLKSFGLSMPVISVLQAFVNAGMAISYQQDQVIKSGKNEGKTRVEVAIEKSFLAPKKQVDDFYRTFFKGDNAKFDFYSKDNYYFSYH